MKKISVDTNFSWFGPDCPCVPRKTATEMSLEVNEKVIAYQDDDKWFGIVRFDESLPEMYQWFIELCL